jgi:hypothetical protein
MSCKMSDRTQNEPDNDQKVYLPLLDGIIMKEKITFLEYLHLLEGTNISFRSLFQ